MSNVFTVALGGALGAVCRYLITLLPMNPESGFPVKTFLINVAGSFLIGAGSEECFESENGAVLEGWNLRWVYDFFLVCPRDRGTRRKGNGHCALVCAA